MHHHRSSNDGIWTAQIQFAFPNEVPLAGSVDFDVPEIADVAFSRVRPAVVLMHRIKMRAGRHRICRRAIAFFMNVQTVLARFEILNVGHHLDLIANFCECNHAGHLAARFWLQLRCCFRDLLRLRERTDGAENCYAENCFHVANVPPFSAKENSQSSRRCSIPP